MKYTKEQFLKAAELGEVSMIDAKHIISLLDEVDIPKHIYIDTLWEMFRIENPNSVGGFKEQYEVFKWLYFKLESTLYTEEQVREAIEDARDYTGYVNTDEVIKSLKQLKQ